MASFSFSEKCSACSRPITDKRRAWIPHRKVVEEKLGREAKLADLKDFVLCPACGLELRSFKDQLPAAESNRSYTFRFDSAEAHLLEAEQDEAERLARRRACRATIAALAGVTVHLDKDEDGAPVAHLHPTAGKKPARKVAEG